MPIKPRRPGCAPTPRPKARVVLSDRELILCFEVEFGRRHESLHPGHDVLGVRPHLRRREVRLAGVQRAQLSVRLLPQRGRDALR